MVDVSESPLECLTATDFLSVEVHTLQGRRGDPNDKRAPYFGELSTGRWIWQ